MCRHLLQQFQVWPNEIPSAAAMEYMSRHHKSRISSLCWLVQISSEQTQKPLKLRDPKQTRLWDNTTVI